MDRRHGMHHRRLMDTVEFLIMGVISVDESRRRGRQGRAMAEGVRVIRRPPAKRRAMHLIGPFGGATGQGHAQGVEDKDLYRAPPAASSSPASRRITWSIKRAATASFMAG